MGNELRSKMEIMITDDGCDRVRGRGGHGYVTANKRLERKG